MDVAEFEASLQRDGFSEITTKSLPHSPPNSDHAHVFDVRALVLEGAITLTTDGGSRTYRAGDVFVMKSGQEHTEAVDAAGVRYVVGRRYSAGVEKTASTLHSVGPEDESRGGHEAPRGPAPTVAPLGRK
ncbi:cupin domain-containing protein [Roseomonas sp. CAU 1739]|uniref:cupin domain-containing protein n=1 Tax=Roseomonas sp. CAU 1739 TaxID=3140364 RepID=UPI00325BBB8D